MVGFRAGDRGSGIWIRSGDAEIQRGNSHAGHFFFYRVTGEHHRMTSRGDRSQPHSAWATSPTERAERALPVIEKRALGHSNSHGYDDAAYRLTVAGLGMELSSTGCCTRGSINHVVVGVEKRFSRTQEAALPIGVLGSVP